MSPFFFDLKMKVFLAKHKTFHTPLNTKNNVNSHPHISQTGYIILVHNGIIENYASLKKELIQIYNEKNT